MMMMTFSKEIKSGILKVPGMKNEEIRNDIDKHNEISFLVIRNSLVKWHAQRQKTKFISEIFKVEKR